MDGCYEVPKRVGPASLLSTILARGTRRGQQPHAVEPGQPHHAVARLTFLSFRAREAQPRNLERLPDIPVPFQRQVSPSGDSVTRLVSPSCFSANP